MIKRSLLIVLAALTTASGIIAQEGKPAPPAASLIEAARKWVDTDIQYDGGYKAIKYPGGDPGETVGVCTDLIVRSYRELGIDLQVLVHEDMKKNFKAYPAKKLYRQSRPDTNIDHRRVPNLMAFFKRHGQTLTVSLDPDSLHTWRAGDIVVFDLFGNGVPSHIGIISDKKNDSGLPLVIHHYPPHPSEDDCLGYWKILGHYRYNVK